MRTLLLAVICVIGGYFLYQYWNGSTHLGFNVGSPATGVIDTEGAKRRGAELGEAAARATGKVEDATAKVRETVGEAALTGKIKAKMALDDTIKARSIEVSTSGSIVTVSGSVASRGERDRALSLARETAGVTKVVDHLAVQN
jgi:hyperosmotically inducible protein